MALCACSSRAIEEVHYIDPLTIAPLPIDDFGVDKSATFAYVDQFNWYLIYTYTYTRFINEYAKSRGWSPPDVNPVCRLADGSTYDDLPAFAPSRDSQDSPEQFQKELVKYIKKLRKAYTSVKTKAQGDQHKQELECVY